MTTPCLAKNWWVLGLRGAAGVLFGTLAFAMPATTLAGMTLFFAVYALADGLMSLGAAWRAPEGYVRSGGLVLEGIAGIVLGLFTIFFPDVTLLTVIFLVAAWALLTGACEIMASVKLRKQIKGEWLLAASGLLSMFFGSVLVVLPQVGLVALLFGVGTYAIASGAVLIALSLKLRTCELQKRAQQKFGSVSAVPRQRPESEPRSVSA